MTARNLDTGAKGSCVKKTERKDGHVTRESCLRKPRNAGFCQKLQAVWKVPSGQAGPVETLRLLVSRPARELFKFLPL